MGWTSNYALYPADRLLVRTSVRMRLSVPANALAFSGGAQARSGSTPGSTASPDELHPQTKYIVRIVDISRAASASGEGRYSHTSQLFQPKQTGTSRGSCRLRRLADSDKSGHALKARWKSMCG